MSDKNAIAANKGTSGNVFGDTYAQAAGLGNAFQDALAGNDLDTTAEAGSGDADLDQSGSVDQSDNNSVAMNINF